MAHLTAGFCASCTCIAGMQNGNPKEIIQGADDTEDMKYSVH